VALGPGKGKPGIEGGNVGAGLALGARSGWHRRTGTGIFTLMVIRRPKPTQNLHGTPLPALLGRLPASMWIHTR